MDQLGAVPHLSLFQETPAANSRQIESVKLVFLFHPLDFPDFFIENLEPAYLQPSSLYS